MKGKLQNLQSFLQDVSDSAYSYSKLCSNFETNPTSYDTHFAAILESRSIELSVLLNEIAIEQAKKLKQPPKLDFNKFIRTSVYPNYKEVFVGDKWVLVPNDTIVNFQMNSTDSEFSFTVTLKHGDDFASFSTTETKAYHQFKDQLLGENLHVKPVKLPNTNFDYKEFGKNVFDKSKTGIGLVHSSNSIYKEIPNSVKRHYAYKISKVSKVVSKEVKAGKIFQATKGLSKSLEILGPVGDVLTFGNIVYEVKEDTWNAHTFVDGTLLVVGIVGAFLAAPEIIVGLAIYGILDFAFDFSGEIDENFGRESDLWKDKPIYQYHREETPMFNKIEIDNTYVAPRIMINSKFKN
jgi:hypothetical protein